MSAKEMKNTAVQTTSDYWGFRELDTNEIDHVSGGDGYGGWGDYDGAVAAQEAANNCAENNANLLAALMQSLPAGAWASLGAGAGAYSGWCSGESSSN